MIRVVLPVSLCYHHYDQLCQLCHHYIQGRIACANVLSDLYAMGVVDCHNMLMLLAGGLDDGDDDEPDQLCIFFIVAKEMTEAERDAVIPLMMQVPQKEKDCCPFSVWEAGKLLQMLQGFQDTAQEAGCLVTGGQTVLTISNGR